VLEGVSHITLTVRDLDRSFAFYTEGLGLRVVSRWAGGAYLAPGEDSTP
jgi:catechol 2,3-dioxygenase-like lactoylglutathione lyase family enzyme